MSRKPSPTTTLPASLRVEYVAALAGLTEKRVRQLSAENKLPPIRGALMPAQETIEALFKYYRRDGETLQREKMLKVSAERKLREHDLAVKEDAYLERGDVGRAIGDLGARLRSVIVNQLVRKLPLAVEAAAPRELKQLARTAVETIGVDVADLCLAELRQAAIKLKDTSNEHSH
jgi:hypothetical protein